MRAPECVEKQHGAEFPALEPLVDTELADEVRGQGIPNSIPLPTLAGRSVATTVKVPRVQKPAIAPIACSTITWTAASPLRDFGPLARGTIRRLRTHRS